jgi:EAL domain-containing protein (putative c-di-GMP-specific phosphodiesterase class I)
VQLRWTPDGSAPAASGAVAGVAERSGLIRELDSWLLEHGCREAVRWAQEHPRLRLDVNVSMHQLRSLAFVEEVGQTLQRTGLAPGDLVVGVSESTLVEAGELAPTVLHGLRDLGVKVALDDFGTGFTSLDRLRRMPLDLLKLDLSLVDRGDRSEAIVAPLVALAHVLDLTVLVEGISTTHERHVATAAGADQAQGSYFARPMSSTAVDLLLGGAVDPEGRLLLPVAG